MIFLLALAGLSIGGNGQGGGVDEQRFQELNAQLENGTITQEGLNELIGMLKAKGMTDDQILNYIQTHDGSQTNIGSNSI